MSRALSIGLRFRKQDGGQSLIETALTLPVFFLMVFALMQFCLILFSLGFATFGTRAVLRYASTHSSTSYSPLSQQGLNNIMAQYIFQYPANTYSVAVSYSTPGSQTGTNTVGSGVYVTFAISYPFNLFGQTYNPIAYSSTGCGIVLQ